MALICSLLLIAYLTNVRTSPGEPRRDKVNINSNREFLTERQNHFAPQNVDHLADVIEPINPLLFSRSPSLNAFHGCGNAYQVLSKATRTGRELVAAGLTDDPMV